MGNWVDAVLPVVSSSLGALLGGLGASWYGTRAAMRKFRHERSYDARVAWHQDLAKTAKVLRNRSRAVQTFKRGDIPAEVALPELQKISELAFRFQELAEQAPLYARSETCVAIGEVLSEMNRLYAVDFENPPTDKDEDGPFEMSQSGLQLVFLMAARDLRTMLNLGPIPEIEVLDRIEQTRRKADSR